MSECLWFFFLGFLILFAVCLFVCLYVACVGGCKGGSCMCGPIGMPVCCVSVCLSVLARVCVCVCFRAAARLGVVGPGPWPCACVFFVAQDFNSVGPVSTHMCQKVCLVVCWLQLVWPSQGLAWLGLAMFGSAKYR